MIDSSGNVVTPEDQKTIEDFAIFLRLRREYRELLAKFGKDAPETVAAYERFKTLVLKAMEEESKHGTDTT